MRFDGCYRLAQEMKSEYTIYCMHVFIVTETVRQAEQLLFCGPRLSQFGRP